MLAVGLSLASVTTFLDIEFVRASHGIYDFEYGGLTGFAGPALVAVALAAWAALAITRSRARLLAALTVVAAAGLIALLLPSVDGAADGIEAGNIPIAGVLIADAMFAIVAAGLVLRVKWDDPA